MIFKVYPCYYCGLDINTESDLIKHRGEYEIGVPNSSSVMLRMDKCKMDCSRLVGTNSAIEVYHSLLKALIRKETFKKLTCEVCHEKFENESMLELHKMFSHPK